MIMSVHNGLRHLPDAVNSILSQSYESIEFIVIDDGSTDGSTEWLRARAVQDDRLKLFCLERMGLTKALNHGLRAVTGAYIARMDADDVACSSRLMKQLEFLEANVDVVCCGTHCRYMDESGNLLFVRKMPQTHEDIEECHLAGRGGFILHPSSMMRTHALIEVGGYDESFSCAQDYDLWFRLARMGRLANLPDVLMDYRITGSAITQARRFEQAYCCSRIIDRELNLRGLRVAKTLPPAYDIRPVDPWWVLSSSSECGYWKTSWRYSIKVVRANLTTILRCSWRLVAAVPLAAVSTVRASMQRKSV